MRLNLVGAAALMASSLFAQLPQGLDLTALQQAAAPEMQEPRMRH